MKWNDTGSWNGFSADFLNWVFLAVVQLANCGGLAVLYMLFQQVHLNVIWDSTSINCVLGWADEYPPSVHGSSQ